MYKIKTEHFEGPLDLLLSLIEEQKLDVTRLSLSKVTDQYLGYMQIRKDATLDNLADFLTVASKLILIKSKALLPSLNLSQEEEREINDLEEQLNRYKKFKLAAEKIGALFSSCRVSFSREGFWATEASFSPPSGLHVFDLLTTFRKILDEIPTTEKLEHEMIREVVTLEEKINHLRSVLERRLETSFSEIAGEARDKIEIIISFLAMLELAKQKIIQVEQNDLFSEITLRRANNIGSREF